MKTTKKIITLLLCIVVAFSSTVTTFAEYLVGKLPSNFNLIEYDRSTDTVAEIYTMDGFKKGDAPLFYDNSFEAIWKEAVELSKQSVYEVQGIYIKLCRDLDADEAKGFGVHDGNDPYGAFGENGEIVLPKGCNVTIDLNGWHIDRFPNSDVASQSGNKRIFKVNGGYLNLISSAPGSYCFVQHARADRGGAIYNGNKGTVIIGERVIISSCYANEGGGIYNEAGSRLMMTKGSEIMFCHADRGGGIYNKGDFLIDGGNISANHADSDKGGGIYNDGGKNVIKDCQMCSNSAEKGAGIYAYDGTIYIGDGTDVYYNVAESDSAGIFVRCEATVCFDGQVTVEDNIGKVNDTRYYDSNVSIEGLVKGDDCDGYSYEMANFSVLTLKAGSYIGIHPNMYLDKDEFEIADKINDESIKYIHLDTDTMSAVDSRYNQNYRLVKGDRSEAYKINTTGSIIGVGNVRIFYILIIFALGLIVGVFVAFIMKKKESKKGEVNA